MQHRVNYLGLLSTLSSPYQYSIYGISFYTTLYIPKALSIDSNYTTTTHTFFPYSLPHTRHVKRDSPHQVIHSRRGPAVVSPHTTFTCELPYCHVGRLIVRDACEVA